MFWFMATLSAYKSLRFVAMDSCSFGTMRFLCNVLVHYRPLNIVVVSSSMCFFFFFFCHGLLVVLVCCGSFVTWWYNIGSLTLLSFSVQPVYFCFMATLSAPKSLFFFCCHGLLEIWYVAQCSFVTLWYIIGPLTLLSSLVQRGYFWFMATLYAPKSLLFVAMDSW